MDLDSTAWMAARLPPGELLDVVHSAGLSAGGYQLADDNPYLPVELSVHEFEAAVSTLPALTQQSLPRLKVQGRASLVVIVRHRAVWFCLQLPTALVREWRPHPELQRS
jgi:hypothetical protein